MNQPSNQTGANNTFSSQPASQTNPFTADLKGEFTSNFGTNTNAVSQIFKEGGFVSNNRTKYMIIGGVVLVVLVIAGFMLMGGEGGTDEFADDSAAGEEGTKTDEDAAEGDEATADADADGDAAKDPAADGKSDATADAAATTDATSAASATTDASAKTAAQTAAPAATGSIALTSPESGASVSYDETQGPATFSWNGDGGYIVFSRKADMTPEVLRIRVSGNSYRFNHPWPGNWYWKVENDSGASEVRSFTVSAPTRRNISVAAPAAGGTVAGTGGQVQWQGDNSVAFYRVELSTGDWANPQFRFATRGNSVQLQGVTAGQYQMRLGAFSEVSGRWEYTQAMPVTVQ